MAVHIMHVQAHYICSSVCTFVPEDYMMECAPVSCLLFGCGLLLGPIVVFVFSVDFCMLVFH